MREDRTEATGSNETWAMDFVHDQLATGKKLRVAATENYREERGAVESYPRHLRRLALSQTDSRDTDLLYDQAMMAEKLGQLPEMERLLRRVIEIKPDAYNAYNALGYSFAERNMRLPEAKQLITKALEFVPNDPFIRDSLGWVEFRLGNNAEALKIFADAFKTKPDAEIAAHYGEVLWAMGQRDKALGIWREGQLLNPENETLLETLKRLKVRL